MGENFEFVKWYFCGENFADCSLVLVARLWRERKKNPQGTILEMNLGAFSELALW